MKKNNLAVITWNGKTVMLSKGKVILHHLIGHYYTARVGYASLLNLDYCVFFERPSGYRGRSSKRAIIYTLLKKTNAAREIRLKTRSMKRGMLEVLTRKTSLRVLLRQIPKKGVTNLPLYRHYYQLVAVCLIGVDGEIVDIDCKSES